MKCSQFSVLSLFYHTFIPTGSNPGGEGMERSPSSVSMNKNHSAGELNGDHKVKNELFHDVSSIYNYVSMIYYTVPTEEKEEETFNFTI